MQFSEIQVIESAVTHGLGGGRTLREIILLVDTFVFYLVYREPGEM